MEAVLLVLEEAIQKDGDAMLMLGETESELLKEEDGEYFAGIYLSSGLPVTRGDLVMEAGGATLKEALDNLKNLCTTARTKRTN